MAYNEPPSTGDGPVLLLAKIAEAAQSSAATSGLTDAELRASPVPVSLSSDIQIGAVEIKDGASNNRAEVTGSFALKVDNSAVTQPVNLTQVTGAAVSQGSGTAAGSLRVELPTNGTGVIAGVTTVTTLTGTTSLTPGTAAANLGKAEDAVAASGDTGVMALAVRRDTAAPSAADLDYNTLNTDVLGKLWTRPEGGAAEGAAATGNPNRVGWMAQDPASPPSAESALDIVTPSTDLQKRALVRQADSSSTTDSASVLGQVLATDNALSTFRTTALTNAAQSVKASGGNLYSFYAINVNTVPVYLKLYNTASGSVVVGTTAIIDTICVPAGNGTTPGVASGSLVDPLYPNQFSTAISVAGVTGLADSDATAPATSIYLKAWYK